MSVRPPFIPQESLAVLVKSYFPFFTVEESSIKQLPAFEDRNYFFEGTLNPNALPILPNSTEPIAANRFVVKILNTSDSKNVKLVDGLTKLTKYLRLNGFNCPYPIRSLLDSKDEMVFVTHRELLSCDANSVFQEPLEVGRTDDHDNRQYCMRVFVYVEGEILGIKTHLCPNLLHELGVYVGNMNKQMVNFTHDGLKARKMFELKLLTEYKQVIPSFIKDARQQAALYRIISDYEAEVAPLINDPSIERGFIHNDMHGLNIIATRKSDYILAINGVIDFANCMFCPHVVEVGVAMGSLMTGKDGINPIHYVKPFLHGYLSTNPLCDKSLDLLFHVILGRLGLYCFHAAKTFKFDPTNEYIMSGVASAWDVIHLLLTEGKERCYEYWDI